MKRQIALLALTFSLLSSLRGDEPAGHMINFQNVPIKEFVKFVSKVAQVNFIYNEDHLDFNVTLVSGKPATTDNILTALTNLLNQHELTLKEERDYFLIKPLAEGETLTIDGVKLTPKKDDSQFKIFKLQYHEGSEILEAVKHYAQAAANPLIAQAIGSMQWIKSSNSLFFSGSESTLEKLSDLIKSLDQPLKQVFIEVLVIETDVRNSLDFGLQWGGGGKIKDKVGYGAGHFNGSHSTPSLLGPLQTVSPNTPPTGLASLPFGRGFDLSVIGDIIFHKGKSFLTLGALINALQNDGDTTIVLNQKIITQDNKSTRIFVGDNIPFTGSVIETVGASQQTTSNVEYRDVGVSLNIKPMMGDDDVINLEISEEISSAMRMPQANTNMASGIETTKTEMITSAHVPDQHFLVLGGMVRNNKVSRKSGVPFLSKIPLLGALFRRTTTDDEKRNIIIFVRPQIINTTDEYVEITEAQEELCKEVGPKQDVQKAIDLIKPKDPDYVSVDRLAKLTTAHSR